MGLVEICFSFSGRVRRRIFLPGAVGALALYGMVFALRLLMNSSRAIFGTHTILAALSMEGSYLLMCTSRIVSGVSFFSFHVRRLHDMNRSGWWASLICAWEVWLFFFFPEALHVCLLGRLALIFLPMAFFVLAPPTIGKNRYGTDPRAAGSHFAA